MSTIAGDGERTALFGAIAKLKSSLPFFYRSHPRGAEGVAWGIRAVLL